jgi:beta-lactamase superfamily II metal-dependent hydrolase
VSEERLQKLLAQAGIPALRTDQVGEIELVLGTRVLQVEVARPPPSR